MILLKCWKCFCFIFYAEVSQPQTFSSATSYYHQLFHIPPRDYNLMASLCFGSY